jgi:hypothetical protein
MKAQLVKTIYQQNLIMVNSAYNSSMITITNSLHMQSDMLNDDLCLKFKMKESILTGKTEELNYGDL